MIYPRRDAANLVMMAGDACGDGGQCVYCTASRLGDGPVPRASDDAAWAELAEEHLDGCEWIATRAHRRDP